MKWNVIIHVLKWIHFRNRPVNQGVGGGVETKEEEEEEEGRGEEERTACRKRQYDHIYAKF